MLEHLCMKFCKCFYSLFYFNFNFTSSGEHEDEGDDRKRAEDEAASAGTIWSPEGKSGHLWVF